MNGKKLVLISAIGLLLLPGCNSSTDVDAPTQTAQQLTAQLTEAQLRQKASEITVRVIVGHGRGSGVLIRKDGQLYSVLTNAHAVSPGEPHQIRTPDGKLYPAQNVTDFSGTVHGYDLAILQFAADADYDVATFASSPARVNQPVFAAGFPYDARDLLFTKGQISMFPSMALQEGYQIGYSNAVQQGMSGGPVLNGSGQLMGINGKSAYPILQDLYQFADGSFPTDEVRKKMHGLSWGVPIGRLPEVDPSFNVLPGPLLTGVAAEVLDVARQITVRIEDPQYNGSGVIIARRGKTYYVLTADHVVKDENKYEVVAPDGKRYRVDYGKVQRLEGVDLAVLQFQSKESYRVATLANYNWDVDKRRWIFLSGWPGLKPGEFRTADPEFTAGRVFSKERGSIVAKNSLSLTNGYDLVYSNPSQGGMSGGPVLDARGRVIGIHAAAEGEMLLEEGAIEIIQLGYSLGVPVRTFLSLAGRTHVKYEWLQVEKTAPPPLTRKEISAIRETLFTAQKPAKSGSAIDWVNYGNQLWRLFEDEEAVAAFDEAIKLKPKFEQAWYGRGLALKAQGKYQAAVASFDKATEINPRLYEAWRERGEALASLQRYREALASLEKAININPKDSVLYMWRGEMLRNLERHAEAVEAYSQAIDIKPHPFAYNNRGNARSDLGDNSGAIADYNKAIEIQPDDASAYVNRGVVRSDLGDNEGAIADYNKAIEIKPDYAVAYVNRGNVRSDLGDNNGALADYNKAIEIKPDDAVAYVNRGNVRSDLGDNNGALADFNKAIEIQPDYAEAYFSRGVERGNLGDNNGAIADFNKAIEIQPDYADAYYNRGVTRGILGDNNGAIADYNKAIEIQPDYADAYNNRGNTRKSLGDNNGAIADYNKAIEIQPDYALAYYNRGNTRRKLGDDNEAIADYNKAIEIQPYFAKAYYNRGNTRRKLGDNNRAIADYNKTIEIQPDFAEAYGDRGIFYNKLGDRQRAIYNMQKAAQLFREQGRMADYQLAQKLLRQFQQQ
ncbi:MAG: tetratricopeptide repeat-containing serine protease family protein [Hormoscilla sp.]